MLGISKFVAKVRIIWELANFRSASRTGDYGKAGRNVKAGTGGTCRVLKTVYSYFVSLIYVFHFLS